MIDASALRNTLIVRTDRMGDVLLTVPMAGTVKRRAPGARVTFLVREYTSPLVQDHPDIDAVVRVQNEVDVSGIVDSLRAQMFTAAFLPSPHLGLARAIRRAGIPVRVGIQHRWYRGLFTHTASEHRSGAARHEAAFNVRMVDPDANPSPSSHPCRVTVNDSAQMAAEKWCMDRGLAIDEPIVVIHPGSGGSARDWPVKNFVHLVARVHHELGVRVVLTGTEPEAGLVALVRNCAGVDAVSALDLPLAELAALVNRAACVVSNSTGVLHLAAAVGTFAVGVYPPVIACSPRRWGPWTNRANVFEPSVLTYCGTCVSARCPNFDCMRLISVESVFDSIAACLAPRAAERPQR